MLHSSQSAPVIPMPAGYRASRRPLWSQKGSSILRSIRTTLTILPVAPLITAGGLRLLLLDRRNEAQMLPSALPHLLRGDIRICGLVSGEPIDRKNATHVT